jgi:predicted PurR-regulated permease PerM
MRFSELEYSTRVILKVVIVVLALAFLWTIREIIALLLLAVVFASAMDPLADYLHKRKIPRGVSVLAVYVIVLGLVGLAVAWVAPSIAEQFRLFSSHFPEYMADFQAKYPSLAGLVGDVSGSQIFRNVVGGGDGTVVSRTVGLFNSALGFITVLAVSFYLVVADRKGMKELIRPLVPPARRDTAMHLVEKIQRKMGYWVLGQILLSACIFAATYIGLTIIGVKYALVLALIAGVLEIVPFIGPILSAVPAFFFALVQSPALAVGVLILYLLVQKTETYVLTPKIMHKAIGASPVVILLALLIGLKLAGVIGLLLAVPLVGAALAIIEEFTGDTSEPKPVGL